MEDTAIVELYWQRNSMAITETEKKYGAYCQTIAFNILANHEDAEECVNDTYLGAWNSMPDNRPSVLAPYLAKITRWQSIARLRKIPALKEAAANMSLPLRSLASVFRHRSMWKRPWNKMSWQAQSTALSRVSRSRSGGYFFFDIGRR